MKMPHILRVEEGMQTFAALVSAAADEDLRVGWLELGDELEVGGSLEGAASLGWLRAVVAGPRSTVVVKGRRGRPVFRDLIRENFRGAALVLVQGAVEAPRLMREGHLWRIVPLSGAQISWDTTELVSALRRPRLFGQEARA